MFLRGIVYWKRSPLAPHKNHQDFYRISVGIFDHEPRSNRGLKNRSVVVVVNRSVNMEHMKNAIVSSDGTTGSLFVLDKMSKEEVLLHFSGSDAW